ncbi:uncharacterized protein LOC116349767 [Contarinia nasturtii]|uniref:uncharacterized protein LOC116349767 n=1 Tax=Contarinia nasturtii TaxID=265458 RepID=UPI0012D4C006|nr:uncharacterized protein LOC116349767 [Contarinia nasturtii]
MRREILKPQKLFTCVDCKKSKINEDNILEHHKKFHSDIPYKTDQYVFLQSVVAREQCIVCEEVLPRTRKAQENHHKNHHSEFAEWKDLYEITFVTTYAKGKEKQTLQNRILHCRRCKTRIDRKNYVEHFERDHPEYYSRTGNHAMTNEEKRHGPRMDGADENDDERGHSEWNVQDADVYDAGKSGSNGGYVVGNGDSEYCVNDNEVTNKNESSLLEKYTFFICSVCKQILREDYLLKHHNDKHSDMQYEEKNYSINKTVVTKFQCFLCQVILNRSERQNHRENCHPQFLNVSDVFDDIYLSHLISLGTKKWSVNKDTNIVNCHLCRISIERNNYAEHFQQEHPDRLMMETSSEEMHENDVEGNETNSVSQHSVVVHRDGENRANDNEITNKNESSLLEKDNHYKCLLCNNEIKESHLFKHHQKLHSTFPYQASNFTLIKSVVTMYQCLICQVILEQSEQQNHQENYHPEFVNFNDIFNQIRLIHNVTDNTKKWSANKDTVFNCKFCCLSLDRNDYIKHFQQKHPERLTSLGRRMEIKNEPSSGQMEVNGVNSENALRKYGVIVKFHKCSICNIQIKEDSLRKHHDEVHSEVAYQASNFTLATTSKKMYQCCICQKILNRAEREIHQQNYHPEFIFYNDTFIGICMMNDERTNKTTWSSNKDALMIRCNAFRCRMIFDRNNYVKHFEECHPRRLTSTEKDMKIKRQPDSEPIHFMEINESSAVEKINWFTCSTCDAEMLEANLLRHHSTFHSQMPYDEKNFTHTKAIVTMFQCFLCQVVLNRTEEQNHHENYHPEFVDFIDFFSEISLVHNITADSKKWTFNKDTNVFNCRVCRLKLNRNNFIQHFQKEHPQRLTTAGSHEKEPTSESMHDANDDDTTANDDVPIPKKATFYNCKLCPRKKEIEINDLSEHHAKFHWDIPYQQDDFIFVRSIKKRFQCNACNTVVRPNDRKSHHEQYHPEFKTRKYLFNLIHLTILPENQLNWSKNKDDEHCKLCNVDIEPNTFVEHFKSKHPEWYNHPESSVEPVKIKKEKVDGTKKRKGEPMPPVKIKKEKIDKESTKNVEMPSVKIKKEKIDAIDRELIKIGKNPATDTEIISYFKCTLCGKNKVKGKKLLKHHDKFHSGIPYQVNTYILNTKERKTPEASDDDVAEPSEPREDEERTTTKNGVQMNTSNTQNEDQSQSEAISMDAQSIDDQKEKDEMMTKITNGKINDAGRNSSSGTSELFTIAVSCAELQRLLQQNRIYSQNGQFILKDST